MLENSYIVHCNQTWPYQNSLPKFHDLVSCIMSLSINLFKIRIHQPHNYLLCEEMSFVLYWSLKLPVIWLLGQSRNDFQLMNTIIMIILSILHVSTIGVWTVTKDWYFLFFIFVYIIYIYIYILSLRCFARTHFSEQYHIICVIFKKNNFQLLGKHNVVEI